MGKWIGIGLAVIAVITIAFIVAAYIFPDFRVATRDIAIVILAVFQMIGAILTAALLIAILYAVFAIRRLASQTVLPKVDLLTTKLDAVIDNAQGITGNFKDTTTSVSYYDILHGRASGRAGHSRFQPAGRGACRCHIPGTARPEVGPSSPIGPPIRWYPIPIVASVATWYHT